MPRRRLRALHNFRMVRGWCGLGIAAFASFALAQPYAENAVQLDGETIPLSMRTFPMGANAVDPQEKLEPITALDTAKLLNRYLLAGDIEGAALLSNAPRRRFEVLRDYKETVGDDGFRQVFAEYFVPDNRLVAEIAMGTHHLLVWHLRADNRYAGQFYVEVEGRTLMDDVPSAERATLRRVLEAIRAGRLSLPLP